MDPYERSKLGDAIKEEKFKKGDLLITEGETGDKFYLVSEGTCIATKMREGAEQPEKVMDYSSGSYFGERALIMNDVRRANIEVTSEECSVLSLERDTFIRLLGPLDELLKRNMDAYKQFK